MKREQLEQLLGKRVRIKLFDGKVFEGELHKTGEEQYKDDPNLYIPKNYYFIENNPHYIFRSSHVKKAQELKKE